MEALQARQQDIICELEKVYTNFKKDGASRKTSEYIQKRVDKLKQLWAEFEDNNSKIVKGEDPANDYFEKKVYDNTKFYYQGVLDYISSSKPKSYVSFKVPVLPSEGESSKPDKLDQLFLQQQSKFRALKKYFGRLDLSKIEDKWEIEDEIKTLQHDWNTIKETHLSIDEYVQGSDAVYEEEFSALESKFLATKRELNKKLCSSAHLRESTPKIEIPIFTGKYAQWPTFHDLFTEAIHKNKFLSNAQKMQHLKGKLKGEAERLIQHLSISTDNYQTAWEILVHRFNNTQLLFTSHIEIFLNQSVMQKQTSFELKKLHDTSMECLQAIQNLGINISTWDPLLVHLLSKKLDTETLTDYKESRTSPRELANMQELLNFIEKKFIALEPIQKAEKDEKYEKNPKHTFQKQNMNYFKQITRKNYQNNAITNSARRVNTCPLCNLEHELFQCKQLFNMSPEAVMEALSRLQICENCLYKHENTCYSKKRCKICNGAHNSLIHDYVTHSNHYGKSAMQAAKYPRSINQNMNQSKSSTKQHYANHVASSNEEILLSTLSIKVQATNGNFVVLRALLDQGSQVTLISEKAAQLLELPRTRYNASISGIGPSSKQSKGLVTLKCQSIHDDFQFSTQALVISRVISDLPNTSFEKQTWPHLRNIQLADPEYNVSRPIDILLDASVYSDIIQTGLIKGSPQAPIAQQTKLGWVLLGNVKTRTFHCNVVTNNIDELSKYWEIEDISNDSKSLTEDDQYCEEFYQATTQCLENGRYVVALPMKPGYASVLGNSRSKAQAQFFQLENKLSKNSEVSESYKQFMNEYIQLKHMLESDTSQSAICYLPHHVVVTSNKMRVVFNASSKTSSGRSLNDLMLRGPNLQCDLQSLILRWRQYKYVLTADIEKMFRQILIRNADHALQTIIWRESPHQQIKEYHLTTLIYGAKASPYLAIRTLRQIAKDNIETYPLAASALSESFYMDDLMCGHDSVEQAEELQRQLIEVLQNAGMNLRKWSSNNPELTRSLSVEQLHTPFEFKDAETRKTLGLRWNPSSDTFTYQYDIQQSNDSACVTKRQLLSEISKTYDPLGWISPITIKGKLLFQKTWSLNLTWDDNLPSQIQNEWKQLLKDLTSLDKIAIPRHMGNFNGQFELHAFCDSSELAFATSVYLVSTNDKGEYTSRLIVAKTKVAPTKKQISLPILELLGAVLLTNLVSKVKDSLSKPNIKVQAWCDSMIVLGWINGDPGRWKPFVSNRIRQITEIIPSSQWNYVKSEENPADSATRGLTSSALLSHSLWWNGPIWLVKKNEHHITYQSYQEPDIEVKGKHKINVNVALAQNQESIIITLLKNKSNLTQVARIITWVFRFIKQLRHRNALSTMSSSITCEELLDAHIAIIKTVQSIEFEREINSLKTKGRVNAKSNIASLCPTLDSKGILRVAGRLANSNISYAAKHPIIIPSRSRLTELIINQAHRQTLHGGPRLTLSHIREKYWIISGVRVVKKQLRSCVKCRHYSQENRQQIMADLPRPRVVPSRPFTHTGVDFTRHIEVKTNKGRGVRTTKGYIAVFVCFATKAVHIELVSDLTAASFLAAFSRFCARRGTPKTMYSDNGTNFVKANKMLQEEYKSIQETINNTTVAEEASNLSIDWKFNVASWPTAAGLWEASVKGLKYHLKRVLGDQRLTYEQLTTLLYLIEACMNSRPLCALTEGPDDFYLTPGHFLVGGPLLARPPIDPEMIDLPTRWQLVQQMTKQFWKAWSREYLQHLQSRSKWRRPTKNLAIGDLVLIKEDNMPPGKWAMGRVQEVHPGMDGYVRVVSLKAKNKVIKRPITKLIELPINENKDSSIPNRNQATAITQRTQNEPRQGTTPRTTRRKNILKSILASTLLFLLLLVQPSYQQQQSNNGLKLTEINDSNSLYFDKTANLRIIRDNWKMIVYYNMSTYWQGVEIMQKYITHLNDLCQQKFHCKSTILQLQHEFNELKYYNGLLTLNNQHRSKRGLINGVGAIANQLFGVLDDNFAQQYQKDIEAIQSNEQHLLKLFKNQTSIIEAQNSILRRNENVMNQQFEHINTIIEHVSTEIREVEKMELKILNAFEITSSIITADVVINNLRNIQETLLNTVTDIYQGRLDIHFLPISQLQEQMNIISGQLRSDISIPVGSGDLRNLYHLLQVKARVRNSYLIAEISIPLTSNEGYELVQIISLPKKRGSHYIFATAASEYLAFDMQRDKFIPLSLSDLQTCIKYNEQELLLCNIKGPIYELKIEQSICNVHIISNNNNQTFCDITARPCTDRWIKLQSANSWLYSCCEVCPVRILCTDSITSQQLRGNGIITIKQDCTIKGDTFTIRGHHSYQNEVQINQNLDLPEISQLNLFINTSLLNLSNWKIQTESHDQQFENIQHKIEAVKTAEESDLSMHHVHHYSMIYIMLIAMIFILLGGTYIVLRKRNILMTRQEVRSIPVQIGMKTAAPPKPPRWRTQASIPTCARSVDDIYSVEQNPSAVESTRSEQKGGSTVNFHIPTFPEASSD